MWSPIPSAPPPSYLIYVYLYIYIYIHIYVCAFVCIYTATYKSTDPSVYIDYHLEPWVPDMQPHALCAASHISNICIHIHIHTCIYVCVCAPLYIHVNLYLDRFLTSSLEFQICSPMPSAPPPRLSANPVFVHPPIIQVLTSGYSSAAAALATKFKAESSKGILENPDSPEGIQRLMWGVFIHIYIYICICIYR